VTATPIGPVGSDPVVGVPGRGTRGEEEGQEEGQEEEGRRQQALQTAGGVVQGILYRPVQQSVH
jgi:hypothetical protein